MASWDQFTFKKPSEERNFPISFDDGQVFYVSRELLSMHGEIFKKMFFSTDFIDSGCDGLPLPGKSSWEFAEFLHCLSCCPKRKEIDSGNLTYIFRFADEYDVRQLRQECRHFLENVVKIVKFGQKVEEIAHYLTLCYEFPLEGLIKILIPFLASFHVEEIDRHRHNLPLPVLTVVYEAKLKRSVLEWVIAEYACHVYSMPSVPIYNTFGHESVKTVLVETELTVIVIDTLDKLEFLIKSRTDFKKLKLIVLMDDIISCRPAMKADADKINLTLLTMKAIIEMGEQNKQPIPNMPPKPSSLVSICYTSGTGGNARGILMTHANFTANCSAIANFKHGAFAADDILLSFMPGAHNFERLVEAAMLMKGGAIGFFSGNVTLLGDDLFHLRPTKIPCVPALLNRVYSNAMAQINSSIIGRCIFQRALESKKRLLEKQIVCNDTIWDCLIFKKIRNYFGGRLKLMICGSAPCSDEVLLFIRAALGCFVVQGYGCTEATAAITCSLEGDYDSGHVGPPVSSSKVKLVAIPETANIGIEKAGEICTFGPCVFQGYFKNPEATAKVLDKDGWLHTGDVGVWTDRGTLKIIGRVNSLFKLSHGEFIAPEKIESVYLRSQFVFQIFVYGDNHHDYVVAVVVPDFNNLKSALRPILGSKVDNVSSICTHEATVTLITHDMHEKAVAAGLHRMEEVKKITIFSEPFTVDNGLVTPTLKVRRIACAKRFAAEILEMYNNP